MKKISPLKRYGQNYLTDQNIISKIISEVNADKNDFILEIGPGRGALSKILKEKCDNFKAVEIDNANVEMLESNYPEIEIINEDFMKLELNDLLPDSSEKLRIVGNIPYNITSPILMKLIENRSFIKDAVLMVQYEVNQKLTAQPKTENYGIISVLINYFSEVKFCFKVSRNVFYPKPKVDSAVMHLYFKELEEKKTDQELFIKVVKGAFGNRRKTLKNSLQNSIFENYIFTAEDFDLSRRAEELDIPDFVKLTKSLRAK